MTSGHSGSVSKVLEFLVVLLGKIQCIHTVNALYLEPQTTQFSKWTRYWESLVESGPDTHTIYWQRTAITFVMSFVKDLVFKSFLVIFFSRLSVFPCLLISVCAISILVYKLLVVNLNFVQMYGHCFWCLEKYSNYYVFAISSFSIRWCLLTSEMFYFEDSSRFPILLILIEAHGNHLFSAFEFDIFTECYFFHSKFSFLLFF